MHEVRVARASKVAGFNDFLKGHNIVDLILEKINVEAVVSERMSRGLNIV